MTTTPYTVEGTYLGNPAAVQVHSGVVYGSPAVLIGEIRADLAAETWVTPHPQPQPPYLLDPDNTDHIVAHLRNIYGFRITSISPPPPSEDWESAPECAVN